MRPCRRPHAGRPIDYYHYDRDGRLLGTWNDSREGPYATSRLIYDDLGRLTAIIAEHAYRELSYHDGLVDSVEIQTETARPVASIVYRYDAWHHPVEVSEHNAGDKSDVSQYYDWSGDRVVRQIDDGQWQYDAHLETMVAAHYWKTWDYVYDARGFLDCRVSGPERSCIGYDAEHRVIEDSFMRYTYDARGRLTTETRKTDGFVEHWEYDCEEPPAVAALFVPKAREEIEPCMVRCIRHMKAVYGRGGPPNFAPRCRSRCEGVGRPDVE
jgi:YD repeat-containing protein